tara:strand:+ start:2985 stop:3353 length:369 start_codon:yes stop_codon:yes gene_type:complete
MTLQTNPPHQPAGLRESGTNRNNGYFQKPSKGIVGSAWSGKEAYTVPEGKYAIVTIGWDNESYGFYVYDKANGQQFAQIGNFGTSTQDAGAKVVTDVKLFAGMCIKAGSSTTVGVVGCEYDL